MHKMLLGIAVFAMGLVSVGCLAGEEDSEHLGVGTQGAGGLATNNHYSPKEFNANKGAILEAAKMRLEAVQPFSEHPLSPSVVSLGLFNTPGGVHTFELAASCGLAAGDYVIPVASDAHGDYVGNGVMESTSGWLHAGLMTAQREDLFSCMVTRLNARGEHVDIMLGGPDVGPPSGDDAEFTFSEGMVTTTESKNRITGESSLTFKFWPSEDLAAACGNHLVAAVNDRICGDKAGGCGLEIQPVGAHAAACTGSDMSWSCAGRPAIQTKIKPASVKSRYPLCFERI